MSNTSQVSIAISIFLSIFVIAASAVYITTQKNVADRQSLVNQAVHECMMAATTVTTHRTEGRDAVTTEPIRDIYTFCLKDKGISQE